MSEYRRQRLPEDQRPSCDRFEISRLRSAVIGAAFFGHAATARENWEQKVVPESGAVFTVQQLATSSSSSTSTEFGDVQLFDLFVSNWPNSKETGFGWAIGPTFVFPTGRVPAAGTHAWEVGPAVAAKYLGVPHLMVGFLFQNPISFAYTNSSAKPQSQCEFQPFISYSLGDGWYVKSADSTWTVNWRHDTSTTLPISLGLGRVWEISGLQLNTWTSGEWTTYRQNTNITPLYTFRFGVTLLFPDFYL